MNEQFREMIQAKREAAAAPKEQAAEPADAELEGADQASACYSVVSADRMRKVMLELRFKTGDSEAIAYSYLLSVAFNPSEGIRLDFGGKLATITGRNLRRLYDALVAQRAAFVREIASEHDEVAVPEDEVLVRKITITNAD